MNLNLEERQFYLNFSDNENMMIENELDQMQ